MISDQQAAAQTGDRSSPDTLAIPGVNTAQAIARFSGDAGRYRYWLAEFVSHGPAAASQIHQSIDSGSRDTAIKLTHALKGRTGMLGMTELHSISQSLEQCLKNGEPTAIWIEELESTIQHMSREIAAVLGPAEA
jgi:HPt (histidine-containing phosphotransfer) domain-containing protein